MVVVIGALVVFENMLHSFMPLELLLKFFVTLITSNGKANTVTAPKTIKKQTETLKFFIVAKTLKYET